MYKKHLLCTKTHSSFNSISWTDHKDHKSHFSSSLFSQSNRWLPSHRRSNNSKTPQVWPARGKVWRNHKKCTSEKILVCCWNIKENYCAQDVGYLVYSPLGRETVNLLSLAKQKYSCIDKQYWPVKVERMGKPTIYRKAIYLWPRSFGFTVSLSFTL